MNRSLTEAAPVEVHLTDGQLKSLECGELLTGPSTDAANTFEQPDVIQPKPFDAVKFVDGMATFELPPLSLAALTFQR